MTKDLFLCTAISAVLVQAIFTNSASASDEDPSLTWIDVRWSIRYLLFVDTVAGKAESVRLAKRNNLLDATKKKQFIYLNSQELLPTTNLVAAPNAETITTALLSFDEAGRLITNDRRLRGFAGKLSELGHVVLVRPNVNHTKPYDLVYWAQGIPGNSSFGPSPCIFLDKIRYEDDWKTGDYPGDFGCREWTAQLFNDERPYIDVTTYTKRGNFIGEFVGWSRFKDAPKPIIGMNGKTWLCLHECPAGEQPGIINDIQAWGRKHNYPLPIPPLYQPEYPNKNYKDDIQELNHD